MKGFSLDRLIRKCPDEMRLAAYSEGGLEPEERSALDRHIAGCDLCLGQLSAVVRIRDSELPDVPPALVAQARRLASAPPALKPWRLLGLSAATACAALALLVSVGTPKFSAPEQVRSVSPTLSAAELSQPHDGELVSRSSLEFRWKPLDAALFYELRVLNADGDLVWQVRAEGKTSVRPPDNLDLSAGQKYFVSVSAFLSEGKVFRSPNVAFQVADR